MDRLEAMSIVLAVAEAGSLSAAARHLNTPPATASRKITELEQHLRAKLFDRSSRKLTLTDSGLSYVAALKQILADLSEADRAASGEFASPIGELIATAPFGLGCQYLTGADIVVAELDRANAEGTASELRGLGRRALVVQTDVMSRKDLGAMVERTM